MAYSTARFGHHHAQLKAETATEATPYVSCSGQSVFEPSLSDADMMQNPDVADVHLRSFISHHSIASPVESHGWTPAYPHNLQIDPAAVAPSQAYREPHHQQQVSHHLHHVHPQTWQYGPSPAQYTPVAMDSHCQGPVGPGFEVRHNAHQRSDSVHGSFSQHPPPGSFHSPSEQVDYSVAPHVQTSMSPHSQQDWRDVPNANRKHLPPRMRVHSPAQSTVDYHRGDGIRKKNARIDIPADRNIEYIENRLGVEKDEAIVKELKQQKRLLRNREAALASRQRKKKHTEELEIREKDYNGKMEQLTQQVAGLRIDRDSANHNVHMLEGRLQHAERIIESMEIEKRELMMKHTEETQTLRKRIRALSDQLEHGDAPLMSAQPSSTGFDDFNAEMEALNMGTNDWDAFLFDDELHGDPLNTMNFEPPKIHHVERSPLNTTTVLQKDEPVAQHLSTDSAPEQHVTSGLLFFLLLCGAFVASKSSTSQVPDLPDVPADVRRAAPAVLNSLLADAQIPPTSISSAQIGVVNPGPSHVATARNRLDRMHHRLTAPTRQQEYDAAWSLTPAEYAAYTHTDLSLEDDDGPQRHVSRRNGNATPRPRRVLADTLAELDEDSRAGKAAVYTRSLLWEQIPADVVKQFREMVRDHDELEALQQRSERGSGKESAKHDFDDDDDLDAENDDDDDEMNAYKTEI